MRHVIDLLELSAAEIARVFEISLDLKSKLAAGSRQPLLPGHVMALIFEKPSLRTRVSFETAMMHLGGNTLFLGEDAGFGKRESIADFSRVLSSYVDVIVCRAFRHATVTTLAEHATCPVINGLTDLAHPCQALADLLTLQELYGSLRGLKLAFVGDANNVASSLAIACAKTGVQFSVAAPREYQFPESFLQQLRTIDPAAVPHQSTDPREVVKGADAVYTDVWTSMGQESERAERLQAFASYQVNEALMREAPNARFMHCLPAHRGEEVTDAVMDGPQSVVVQQAANRMHLQKGLLAWLLK
jgi:ornithine carbamoyltransferase